jgi:uncharacterized membrane protein
MDYLKIWAGTLVSFLILDFTWIGLVANQFYKKNLGPFLRMNGDNLDVLWGAALVLYAIMVAGIVLFILPVAKTQGYGMTFLYGAAFGLTLYATYDLTNYALVKNWPLNVTIIDMIWGAVLCGTTSLAMKWIAQMIQS